MLDKTVATLADAVKDIRDGATLLVSGFGASGIPTELLVALLEQGARDLTVVNNNGGNGPAGLSQLFLAGRVRKLICSFARSANPAQPSAAAFAEVYRAGKIELECVPQGIMVERMRAAAAGLGPFFSPVSYGSKLAESKETRVIDGKPYVLEAPLHADFAFVRARRGDRIGNLQYYRTARNFNPMMATAADVTIAEVEELVEPGAIDPDHVITPGIFVRHILKGERYENRIEKRTTRSG